MWVLINHSCDWSANVCIAWWYNSWFYYLRDFRWFAGRNLSCRNHFNNLSAKRLYQVNVRDAYNCSKFWYHSRALPHNQHWHYQPTDRLILSDRKRRPRSSLRLICLHAKSWLRLYYHILSERRSLSYHSRLSVLRIYRPCYKWSLSYR